MSFTYVCFVFISFNFGLITSSQVLTKIENATFQNIDFVEIVKENLQRNNEDYGEIKYDNNSISTTKGYNGITKTITTSLKVNNNDIFKSNRRAKDESREYNYYEQGQSTTKETRLITNATTAVKPVPKILRSTTEKKIVTENLIKRLKKVDIPKTPHTVKPITNATQTLQIKDNKILKLLKKNKMEKLKKFMVKNKGLIKGFISSKKDIKTKTPISNNALRINDVRNNLKLRTSDVANVLNYDHLFGDQNGRISLDILDMAPAKGGRIHRQRVKGRLCQRHVLVPEGPKYDSQGKWYLPAHNLVVHHPYNVTIPPKLILPRCCNCCKKSVLGCE